jgi:uncharacterized protein (TIGR02145 family)
VEQLAGNTKGVRVIGNARVNGSFSATVRLLTATTNVAGACAYASNYPPVADYTSATHISFTGTPMYDLVLEYTDESTITQQQQVNSPYIIPPGYTLQSFSDKTGAPGIIKCIPPATFTLIASGSSFCVGEAITFALSGTENGRNYQLCRGATPVGLINGDGSAATFSGTFNEAGNYTAQSIVDGMYCAVSMDGEHTVAAYPTFTAGEITTASTTTPARTDPEVTIQSVADAQGGSGSMTYLWHRTGTSSATLTGSAATYAIDSDTYNTAGTYYINRYAKDLTCNTVVAATGTYTLEVLWTDLPENPCSYAQPPVVSTFAAFDENYSTSTYISLTDERDGKNYPVVKIGNWWIMAQNLNYQGVASTSSSLTWLADANKPNTDYSGSAATATIGTFWCPGGSSSSTVTSNVAGCEVWGALYSWRTAMMVDGKWNNDNRTSSTWSDPTSYGTFTFIGNTNNEGRGAGNHGICPANWHVPTDSEWGQILNAMESESGSPTHNTGTGNRGIDAGRRGKSSCIVPDSTNSGNTYVDDIQANWYYNASREGTDNYRFRVLPAGYRYYNGSNFSDRGRSSYFWSSTPQYSYYSWYRYYSYSSSSVNRTHTYSSAGYAVRCIKTPVLAPPTINVSSPTIDASNKLCKGDEVTFSIASPVSGATYTWSGELGTPSGTGNATYTVHADAAPALDTLFVSAYAVVPVGGATYQSPEAGAYALVINPEVMYQPASRTVCRGNRVQFAVQSSTASSYQWRFNGNVLSGATLSAYTSPAITANGTYSAVVSNRCGSATTQDVLIDVNATSTNFTAFNPTGGEPIGTTWCLVDTRESNNNQTYTVRKMPDNRIWMVQDMKFGYKCTKTTMTPSTTNTGNQTSSKLTNISGYSYGDCMSSTYTNASPASGYLYDFAAAVQKAGAYARSGTTITCAGSDQPSLTCRGICPFGWHIPSYLEFTTNTNATSPWMREHFPHVAPNSLHEPHNGAPLTVDCNNYFSMGYPSTPFYHTATMNTSQRYTESVYNRTFYWYLTTGYGYASDTYNTCRGIIAPHLRCIRDL